MLTIVLRIGEVFYEEDVAPELRVTIRLVQLHIGFDEDSFPADAVTAAAADEAPPTPQSPPQRLQIGPIHPLDSLLVAQEVRVHTPSS